MSGTPFEPHQASSSVLGAFRRALQETTSNSQVCALEIPDFGHSKTATTSQATIASILEQRRRVQARACGRDFKSTFPLQRVKQYQEYRARQRARQGHDNEADNAAIWPDEIEDAFTEALYRIPPIGRGKISLHRKPHGRNELISEYILKKTGVKRCRKQVSSHIQVLKGKMANVPEFMKLVTSKASSHVYDENPFADEELVRLLTGEISPAKGRVSRMNSILDSDNFLYPRHFAMFVQASGEVPSFDRSLHTYASLTAAAKPLRSVPLDSVPHWRSKFPHLGSLHQPETVDCQIVLFEVSFDTMADLPRAPSSLCTQFEVASNDKLAYHSWECKTKIYTRGKIVYDLSHQISHVESIEGTSKLQLPFASQFWSDTFTGILAGMVQRAQLGREGNTPGLEDDSAESALRGISVVQELLGIPTTGRSSPKRVAIFLWKFRKAESGEAGTVEWGNLIPPPSQVLANSTAQDGQYNESIPENTESSNALKLEPWEAPLSSVADHLDETYQTPRYTPVHSTPPHGHSPAPVYYDCFSQDMQPQSLQGSLNTAVQLNYFTPLTLGTYDDNLSYIHTQDDSQQQFHAQWQNYPSPFSDAQFQMQFPDVNVDCSVSDAPSFSNVF